MVKKIAHLCLQDEAIMRSYLPMTIDELTAHEAEILLSLDLEDTEAFEYKKKIAGVWYSQFYRGGINYRSDKWKALKYYQIARSDKNITNTTITQELDELEKSTAFKTSSIYACLSWMNMIRQFVGRLDRAINIPLAPLKPGVILGCLIYALQLLVDSAMIVKAVVLPTKEEKKFTASQRFHNILNKDNRATRMRNDAVWLLVNLPNLLLIAGTAVLTGGLSVILFAGLTIAAAAFDVWNEHRKITHHLNRYEKLSKKLSDNYLQSNDDVEKKQLKCVITPLEQKIKTIKQDQKRALAVTATILACVGLAIICPGTIVVSMLICFLVGSVYTGLGRNLKNLICDNKKKVTTSTLQVHQQLQHSQPAQNSLQSTATISQTNSSSSLVSCKANPKLFASPSSPNLSQNSANFPFRESAALTA